MTVTISHRLDAGTPGAPFDPLVLCEGHLLTGLPGGGHAVAHGLTAGAGRAPHVTLLGPDGTPLPSGPIAVFSGAAADAGLIGQPVLTGLADGRLGVAWLADTGLTLESGCLATYEAGQTSLPGVWAGGDCCAGGLDLTVEAVDHGKRAALAIHQHLAG